MHHEIKLSNGGKTVVDKCRIKELSKRKWYLGTSGYVQRTVKGKTKALYGTGAIMMHRFILNAPKGAYCDHINGNKLDNRRKNLRLCNASQNGGNSKIRSDNTSGIKGVHFCNERKKFVAQISINNKIKNLGRFDDLKLAVKAYKSAAKYHFGKFMRLS